MESVFLIFSIDKKLLLQSNPAIQSFSIDRKNVMSTIQTSKQQQQKKKNNHFQVQHKSLH